MIPRLITQTWRSAELDGEAERLSRTWRERNPSWCYRLFDDEACLRVVKEVAPEYVDDYLRFPHPVMRADFFRYAVIHRDGGLYADLDMECVRPIEPLLQLAPTLFSVEARLTARRQHELGYLKPFQIANCVFASEPGSPFLRAAMDRAVASARSRRHIGIGDVEDITGPRMLTRLFYEQGASRPAVLKQIYLMPPMHYPALWPLDANIFARHHFFGSWKQPGRTRPLARVLIERDKWPSPLPASFFETRLEPQQGRKMHAEVAR